MVSSTSRACLGSAGEETDGDKSVGYYSGARSDSSSMSVYSDHGVASLSPAFSDANQDPNKMTPLNLITDADNSNNNQNYSSSSNRKARNKRASRVPSNALLPESSSQQQNQYNNSNSSTSNNKASATIVVIVVTTRARHSCPGPRSRVTVWIESQR